MKKEDSDWKKKSQKRKDEYKTNKIITRIEGIRFRSKMFNKRNKEDNIY